MVRWLAAFTFLCLPVLHDSRAEPAGGSPVWSVAASSPDALGRPLPDAKALENSSPLQKIVAFPAVHPGGRLVKPDGKMHWRNVPRQAWLILAVSLGLLGLNVFFRMRPRRDDFLRPIVVIGRGL